MESKVRPQVDSDPASASDTDGDDVDVAPPRETPDLPEAVAATEDVDLTEVSPPHQPHQHAPLPPLHVQPQPPIGPPNCPSDRANRKSVRKLLRDPRKAMPRLGPQTARASTFVAQQAASFHKRALKVSAISASSQSQLKLGSLKSKEVSTLVFTVRLAVLLGPILQALWTIFIEPDSPSTAPQTTFSVGLGDGAEATIQLLVVLTTCLFARRTWKYSKRQPVQARLANALVVAGTVAAITFCADILKSSPPNAKHGRKLLSFANAFLAGFVFVTFAYLTDYFAETILTSKEAFQHAKQQRLLKQSRQLSFQLWASCFFYMAVRLALTWRSDIVFDFIPMANAITPFRVRWMMHKDMKDNNAERDGLIISAADMALVCMAFIKCYSTHRLFNDIFLSDYARIYTEFRIFVVNFGNTVSVITLSGHIAAWAVPSYHTIDPNKLVEKCIRVENTGSVQMQLGFRFSVALWLISAAYCALPADAHGLRGWIVGYDKSRRPNNQVKHFLSEADVLLTTAFRDLTRAGQINPTHFILENQVEAFNFAQLVYARGNKNYDQELVGLQKLVGDPSFSIVEIVHHAETDTHCLVLASETKIVVTFRGTLSKKNAQTDLQSAMALHETAMQLDWAKTASGHDHSNPTQAGKSMRTLWQRLACKRHDPYVHSGFYAAYLSVADRVLRHVRALYDSNKRSILVTGHSLGGALAVLCSFDIVTREQIANVTCTTFGCPRVGNHAFQKRYNHAVPATFAFVNASDMITKLPPKTPKAQSYTSVGKIVLINSFGNLVIEPNMLELDMVHRGYSAKAHTMRAYHLSLLLWCLRSHDNKYHPLFWRQSLAFLQAEYGHLRDVRDYLKTSALAHARLQPSVLRLSIAGGRDDGEPPSAADLRGVVRRLESALRQEGEGCEDDALAVSLLVQLRQWLRPSGTNEWFAADDAVRVLVAQQIVADEAAAVDLAQELTVQGLLKPERVAFKRGTRFSFPILDEDDDEADE